MGSLGTDKEKIQPQWQKYFLYEPRENYASEQKMKPQTILAEKNSVFILKFSEKSV